MIDGKHVQVFPEFGVERRGAPVAAFLRISAQPIRLRCKVYEPDHLVVLDRALLGLVDESAGMGGWFVANTPEPPEKLGLGHYRAATVDATAIARAHNLGSNALPVVNSPMAGAFARVTGLISFDALLQALREVVPTAVDANVAAAVAAWEQVRVDSPWEIDVMERAFTEVTCRS